MLEVVVRWWNTTCVSVTVSSCIVVSMQNHNHFRRVPLKCANVVRCLSCPTSTYNGKEFGWIVSLPFVLRRYFETTMFHSKDVLLMERSMRKLLLLLLLKLLSKETSAAVSVSLSYTPNVCSLVRRRLGSANICMFLNYSPTSTSASQILLLLQSGKRTPKIDVTQVISMRNH